MEFGLQMKTYRFLILLALISLLNGCGQSSSPSGEDSSGQQSIQTEDELKERLEYIAESGQTGSGLAGIPEMIEKISDATKKSALMEDFHKLEKSNSSTAKSVAKSMLQKLK